LKKNFSHFTTFWFGTFAILLLPLVDLLVMKTVEDEVFCYKGYMFSVFVVLRYFVIYCMQYICYNALQSIYAHRDWETLDFVVINL